MSRYLALEVVGRVGEVVTIKGWVNARRDMGKIAFFDVRDRSGIVQVVGVPSQLDDASKERMKGIRLEYCVAITGTVQPRQPGQENLEMPTGAIELLASSIEVLNESLTPPFAVNEDTSGVSEELRLTYRYLDLRSARMQRNIRLRDKVISFFRDYLHQEGFVEIETPYLTKGTPEGAREFLVPSRIHPGSMYVLPQSPQQFKQLLMVGGMERYFQIARCFRDEDQRGDRQPEFTQLDLEMSFVEQEDVLSLIEDMMIKLVQTATPEKRIQQVPFPRLSYAEAMEKYGSDKPDLREDKNDPNLLAFAWVLDFPFFEKTDEGGWTFTHNPFSAAKPEHREWLMNKERIGEILTTQYDIVLNGYEAGGGSIRNHQPEALRRVLEIMGMTAEEIESQFGHMLRAFEYGAPPHGGIAPGIDRIVMILANEPNIREVIPLPKTGDAQDLLMAAPSPLPEARLRDVHIRLDLPPTA
ncbi:aspartate--tRNA ligase [Patescibacteria group bacterium]|nr:aspartate--tRNA ligase [Patescibacteria group bacterium]MDQ5919624.1 aspartyl-tRNA synthetase [Patescibacteria group bacterium]